MRTSLLAFTAAGTLATLLVWGIRGDDPGAGARKQIPELQAGEPDALAVVLAAHTDLDPEAPESAAVAAFQQRIRAGDVRPATLERLGWAFVALARTEDDAAFYELAVHVARAIEERSPGAAAAKLLRGHALHGVHRFEEAEAVARELIAQRQLPMDYALLGDVLLDRGRIDEAVRAYQRMMRLRPDAAAYARTATVRELSGDLEGALEAARAAAGMVSARGAESFAWTWARLAELELRAGRFPEAHAAAGVALDRRPDHAYAHIVAGKAFLAQQQAEKALAHIEHAASATGLPEQLWLLAETYRQLGDAGRAKAVEDRLTTTGALHDPRGLAAFLAETGREPARALALAEAELRARRDVHTLDTLAMARLAAGDVPGARDASARSLAPGSRDARLLYHAGVIAEAAGARIEARHFFLRASQGAHTLLPSQRAALERRLAVTANDSSASS